MSFSEDPTQRAAGSDVTPGEDPIGSGSADASVDPTLGTEVGEQPYEDPAQGADVGEESFEDPSQGDELGSLPGEDPAS